MCSKLHYTASEDGLLTVLQLSCCCRGRRVCLLKLLQLTAATRADGSVFSPYSRSAAARAAGSSCSPYSSSQLLQRLTSRCDQTTPAELLLKGPTGRSTHNPNSELLQELRESVPTAASTSDQSRTTVMRGWSLPWGSLLQG